MSIGLDAIPLNVFRGVVAFATGRFTVGRLDGGVKVCGPEHKAWSAHDERQSTAREPPTFAITRRSGVFCIFGLPCTTALIALVPTCRTGRMGWSEARGEKCAGTSEGVA